MSYAVTSDRTSVKDKSGEQQKLDQAVIDNYMVALAQGRMTLTIARWCDTINYDPPSEWSGSNFKCHMFHPDGAGVAYQDLGVNQCELEGGELTDLAIGEACGGIVYAGTSGGNRIYTTQNDLSGTLRWSNVSTTTGATSTSDGLLNTNAIVALNDTSYPAASGCRALGPDWYLPSKDELDLLYQNRNIGLLSGTFVSNLYTSSTETSGGSIWRQSFSDGSQIIYEAKAYNRFVRCVRRD